MRTSSSDPADGPALEITLRETHAAVVVSVFGEIDEATDPKFRGAIESALSLQANVLVVDLSEVTFLGSRGIRALIAARDRADELGAVARFVVPGGQRVVRRPLEITEAGELLQMFDDVESAACEEN